MSTATVLYLVTEPWYFANHRLDHAKALISADFNVHVATRMGERWDEIADAGCTTHQIDLARGSGGLFGWLGELRAARKLVRSVEPDVVHAVALKPVAIALGLILMRRRPALILSINGLGLSSTRGGARIRAIRGVVRAASRLGRVHPLFQTNADRSAVMGHRAVGTVIPGVGVDTDRFQPGKRSDEDPLDVVYLGRAVVSKGLSDLAAAVEHDPVEGVRVRLYCVIDELSPGALSGADLRRIERNPNVELLPATRYPEQVLARAAAAILPSRSGEGVSKFVLEALACGAPVLLSAESGSGEVIEPGATGLVFTAADPSSIRAVLVEFAGLPADRRHAMSAACRASAERDYSLDAIAPRIVALHQLAVSGRRV